MRLARLCLAALVVCSAGALAAAGTTFPLSPVALGQPQVGSATIDWTPAKPADAGPTPNFAGATVYYADIKLGDNPPMLAAIAWRTAPAGPPVVFLDLNGNRSLADEKRLRPTKDDTQTWAGGGLITPSITIPVQYKLPDGIQTRRDYRFRWLFTDAATPSPFVLMAVESGMGGTVKLGDKDAVMTLIDGDGNATFATDGRGWDACHIYLTPVRVDEGHTDQLMRYVGRDGVFFELAVRPDGGEITITPYDRPLARLTFAGRDGQWKPADLSLVALYNSELQLYRRGNVRDIAVVPGEYVVTYALAGSEDSPGGPQFTTAEPIKAVAGKTTELRCGGKLDLDVTIAYAQPPDTALTVAIKPTTADGGHAFRGGSSSETPAKVEVLNAAGKVLGAGSAQYG